VSPNARKTIRLAVLIDAENVSPKYVKPLLEEIAKLGTATARRIYGDWTQPQQASWRNLLNLHALIPIQQFQLSVGKNCTDCALIIDAMDLLYSGNFEGFCIVSSDSDFTRLACRIRESGLLVYGFGERKTPSSFVKSCDRFIAMEILANSAEVPVGQCPPPGTKAVKGNRNGVVEGKGESNGKHASASTTSEATAVVTAKDAATQSPASKPELKRDQGLSNLVKAAYVSVAGEDGWAPLSAFGAQMLKLSPSFDPRNFGCGKLGDFIIAIDLFEVKKVPHKNPLSNSWYIKAK
jgi:hypothetical protein